MRIRFLHIVCIIFWILSAYDLSAQDVAVTGGWTLDVDDTDIVGEDLTSVYESDLNSITINVTHASYNANKMWRWRVSIAKNDNNWPTQFTLEIYRTGDGTGAGSITGGTVYQTIDSVNRTFFSGSKHRYTIPVRLRLSGVTPQVTPNTYQTSVVYTVVEI